MFKEKIFRNQIKNLLLYFAMTGKVPTFAPAFGNEAVLIERLTD